MTKPLSGLQGPKRAVLVAHSRVSIGDVSRTGCRFQAAEPLSVGTVGMLSVRIGGEARLELFRVSRSAELSGGERKYEMGVEFLPLPAERGSLQDIVVQIERTHSIG